MDEQNTQVSHARAPAAAMRSALRGRTTCGVDPFITRKIRLLRGAARGRLALDGAQRRYDSRGDWHRFCDEPEALEIWKAGAPT